MTEPLPQKYINRFWQRVDRNIVGPCWGWKGNKLPTGYGYLAVQFGGKRRTLYAHRVSYEAHHGPIPEGLDVMHSCDNRWCCNPAHLSVGTRLANMADAKSKGRRLGRAPNPNSLRQQALRRRAA